METKTLEKSAFNVKEGKTIITVPHLEDKVSFVYPSFKGNYESVGKQIEENGLVKPTPEQTASLVYSAYQNLDNKYAKEISQEKLLEIFNGWLAYAKWGNTHNLINNLQSKIMA